MLTILDPSDLTHQPRAARFHGTARHLQLLGVQENVPDTSSYWEWRRNAASLRARHLQINCFIRSWPYPDIPRAPRYGGERLLMAVIL